MLSVYASKGLSSPNSLAKCYFSGFIYSPVSLFLSRSQSNLSLCVHLRKVCLVGFSLSVSGNLSNIAELLLVKSLFFCLSQVILV